MTLVSAAATAASGRDICKRHCHDKAVMINKTRMGTDPTFGAKGWSKLQSVVSPDLEDAPRDFPLVFV